MAAIKFKEPIRVTCINNYQSNELELFNEYDAVGEYVNTISNDYVILIGTDQKIFSKSRFLTPMGVRRKKILEILK